VFQNEEEIWNAVHVLAQAGLFILMRRFFCTLNF